MENVEIVIPDDILVSIKLPRAEIEKELKLKLALILYSKGALSLGKAAKLAGITKREFLEELARRKIPRHYTERELEEDLNFARG